jgi:quercetin dioxygenase-like cupin family protein
MHVYEHDDLTPVPSRPGIEARSLAGPKHGVTDFFVQENRLHHAACIPLHTHPVNEVVIVTEGELTVETGEGGRTRQTVGGGHTVVIPPGTPHRLSNQSADPVTMLAAAAWDHSTFYRDGSTYLEGGPRQ